MAGKKILGFFIAAALMCALGRIAFAAEPAPDLAALAKTLADGAADHGQRLEAARKLGEAKNPEYLAPLIAALKDSNKALRWAAVEALWDIGDKRAVPALIAYLGKGEAYDWGKVLTMNALGAMRDPQAVDPLLKVLQSPSPFLRRSSALALARLGDDRAITGIIELLNDEQPWLQRTAQEILVDLAKDRLAGDIPSGYDEWRKWREADLRRPKIEGGKKP